MKVFLAILVYIFCHDCQIENHPVEETSYDEVTSEPAPLPYRIINWGTTQLKDSPPLLINSDKEYFDYYYNTYGVFPENFKWDFEKESILVIYKTLTSGTHGIIIDKFLEADEEIKILTSESWSEFHTCDMSNKYLMLAIPKTYKRIVTN